MAMRNGRMELPRICGQESVSASTQMVYLRFHYKSFWLLIPNGGTFLLALRTSYSFKLLTESLQWSTRKKIGWWDTRHVFSSPGAVGSFWKQWCIWVDGESNYQIVSFWPTLEKFAQLQAIVITSDMIRRGPAKSSHVSRWFQDCADLKSK